MGAMKIPQALTSAVLGALLCWPSPAGAQSSLINTIQELEPSIVGVTAQNSEWFKTPQGRPLLDPQTGRLVIQRKAAHASYQRSGTGIVVDASGIIVTNAHNVLKADVIAVTVKGLGDYPAQVLELVNDLDLCLLKIETRRPLRPVPLADSDQLALGEEIISLGNSPFIKGAISSGKITGLGTSVSGAADGIQLIRTSVDIYKGDSGGPLFDRTGRLVGLMTAKEMSADHSSFAIPANRIAHYLNRHLPTP